MPQQKSGQDRGCVLPMGSLLQHPWSAGMLPFHCPPSTRFTLLQCSGSCRSQSSAWLYVCLDWLWVICLHQLPGPACARRHAHTGVLSRVDKSRCSCRMWPVASCLCITLTSLGPTSVDGRNPHCWGYIALTYLDQKNSQGGKVQSWTSNTSVIKKSTPNMKL